MLIVIANIARPQELHSVFLTCVLSCLRYQEMQLVCSANLMTGLRDSVFKSGFQNTLTITT